MAVQNVCEPVETNFPASDPREPADVALLTDPSYAGIVEDIATELTLPHARHGDTDPGVAARRTIRTLGCESCKLTGVCAVEEHLLASVQGDAENRTLAEKVDMLAAAPRWLAAARLNRVGMEPDDLRRMVATAESAFQALRSGELNVDALLGGVTNTFADLYTKDDLPELSKLTLSTPEQLSAHAITTPNKRTFVVIDASTDRKDKGYEAEAFKEYSILCSKLLDRMCSDGPDGQPQIMHQDQKMQKAIQFNGDSVMYEMRMSGKNRLYFTVMKSPDGPDGPTARIVILGAHGGDASTQRAFIDTALGK